MPIGAEEIEQRFTYHPPRSGERVRQHEGVRDACLVLAEYLDEQLPDERWRDKSIAIEKVEEAMFWANAALARSIEGGGGDE